MQHSYSKLSVYETCPFKFKQKYIEKIKVDQDRTALDRGIDIHEKAEKYVSGELRKMPKELMNYKTEFQTIKKLKATKEMDLSYTQDYEPCKWNDWGSVWVINKPDSLVIPKVKKGSPILNIDVIDYKTGKVYDSHRDQSDMGAIACFIHYPDCEVIVSEFWYLDYPEIDPGYWEYDRDRHFEGLKHNFLKRHNKMSKDKKFRKVTGFWCRWCEYNAKKGGQCDKC